MPEGTGGRYKWGDAPKSDWIDISIPFRHHMVHWPTDPDVSIERIKDVDSGDRVTLTQMQMISHTGTHLDAPLHFIYHGRTIDEMPLNAAIGTARVIEISDTESIKPDELAAHNIQKGERILFKTRNSSSVYQTDEFIEDYVYIIPAAAQYLVERGVQVVGIDYISVGNYHSNDDNHATHQTLLNNGVYIIEGLDLSQVRAGNYELICLPIKLERGDAGLARAILRPLISASHPDYNGV